MVDVWMYALCMHLLWAREATVLFGKPKSSACHPVDEFASELTDCLSVDDDDDDDDD